MKIHVSSRKKNKDSEERYISLRYYEGKKHISINRTLYPTFKTADEAREWLKNKESLREIYESLSLMEKLKQPVPLEKLEKSKKHLEWKKRFYEHYSDFKNYIEEMKKPGRAPNSWKATRVYLEYYVFHFFLLDKNEGNYIFWHRLFPGFVKWLEDEAISSKTGKPLSYSTRNACIKTLNSFLKYIGFQKFSNKEPLLLIRCPSFANELLKLNQRTYKDIILEDELKRIVTQLNLNNKNGPVSKTGEFLTVLYNSGMRFQELYTMTIDSVISKPEKIPQFMIDVYARVGKPIYGYLVLKSQSLEKTRDKSRVTENMRKDKELKVSQEIGTLLRKPLKSKKAISPKNNRLIPIWDQTTWEIIKKNHTISAKKCLNKFYGLETNGKDYYLFDEIEVNQLRNDMRKVTQKSFHATRHSFITLTTGFLISKNIVPESVMRPITGITSKVLENYTHTYEELMLSVAAWDNEEIG